MGGLMLGHRSAIVSQAAFMFANMLTDAPGAGYSWPVKASERNADGLIGVRAFLGVVVLQDAEGGCRLETCDLSREYLSFA